MRPLTIIPAALVAAFFMAAPAAKPAAAQMFARTMRLPCAAPGVLPGLLVREYGEAAERQGVADGALVQLWRNLETGSWTILLIAPDGSACALASGEDWMLAEPLRGDGT